MTNTEIRCLWDASVNDLNTKLYDAKSAGKRNTLESSCLEGKMMQLKNDIDLECTGLLYKQI